MDNISEPHLSLLERLWTHVDTSGDCWLWTGSDSGGHARWNHGKLTLPGGHMTGAHRVAWELAYGPIPTGSKVCHHCDTPKCCRPSHLFLGTNEDNLRDAMRKRRLAGKLHPIERERLARAVAGGDLTASEAAREGGVNPSTVHNWLKARGLTAPKNGRLTTKARSPENQRLIAEVKAGELTGAAAARKAGVTKATMYSWLRHEQR